MCSNLLPLWSFCKRYFLRALDIGEDTGTPVSEDYKVPFPFTGTLHKVAVRLGAAKLGPDAGTVK